MPIPHLSYVHGESNVQFLKRRYDTLSNHPLFAGMDFSDNREELAKWMPLMMKDRTSNEPVAATKIDSGTDVNFGALTRMLLKHLQEQKVEVHYKHSVKNIKRKSDKSWELTVKNLTSGAVERHRAKFIFIGAGGGSLHLLQKSGIPEGKHIGASR